MHHIAVQCLVVVAFIVINSSRQTDRTGQVVMSLNDQKKIVYRREYVELYNELLIRGMSVDITKLKHGEK